MKAAQAAVAVANARGEGKGAEQRGAERGEAKAEQRGGANRQVRRAAEGPSDFGESGDGGKPQVGLGHTVPGRVPGSE